MRSKLRPSPAMVVALIALFDRENNPEGFIRLDPAQLGTSAVAQNRHDHVAIGIDQFDRLDAELVEGVDPVLHVCPHGVLAMNRPSVIRGTLDRAMIEIVSPMLEESIKAAAGECSVSVLHGGDALLRHRLHR
jgi:hypothetical protein